MLLLAQEEHGDDVTILDEVYAAMARLIDRNRELANRIRQLRDQKEELEALWESEIDDRVMLAREVNDLKTEKQQLKEKEKELQTKV